MASIRHNLHHLRLLQGGRLNQTQVETRNEKRGEGSEWGINVYFKIYSKEKERSYLVGRYKKAGGKNLWQRYWKTMIYGNGLLLLLAVSLGKEQEGC